MLRQIGNERDKDMKNFLKRLNVTLLVFTFGIGALYGIDNFNTATRPDMTGVPFDDLPSDSQANSAHDGGLVPADDLPEGHTLDTKSTPKKENSTLNRVTDTGLFDCSLPLLTAGSYALVSMFLSWLFGYGFNFHYKTKKL